MRKIIILLLLTPTILFAQLRNEGLRKKTNTTSHISIADTIEATKAKIDTLEGFSSDSVFTKADMVFLQDILFKASSSNVSYWIDTSGDTVLTIDPNGASGPLLILTDATGVDTVQLYHDGTKFNIVPDAGTATITIDGAGVFTDSIGVRGTSELKGLVLAKDKMRVEDSLAVGLSTVSDNVVPKLTLKGDADSDAAATTAEELTLSLTGNANPTSAFWAFTNTQGVGYRFDDNIGIATASPKDHQPSLFFGKILILTFVTFSAS